MKLAFEEEYKRILAHGLKAVGKTFVAKSDLTEPAKHAASQPDLPKPSSFKPETECIVIDD